MLGTEHIRNRYVAQLNVESLPPELVLGRDDPELPVFSNTARKMFRSAT